MSENRRLHLRLGFDVEVTLQSEHNFYTGFTENISEGGLFIATEAECEMGDVVQVEFTIPGYLRPLKVDAVVCWVRTSKMSNADCPRGYGVEFLQLPPDAAKQVNRFIAQRAPLFYDEVLA